MLGKVFNLLAFCLVGWLGLAHAKSPASVGYNSGNSGGGSNDQNYATEDWVEQYVANAIKPPSPKYTIGQYAEGGVVFWLDSTGQHGLVCSIEDMANGVRLPWGVIALANATSNGLVLGCDSAGKITTPGKIDTNLIVAQNGPYDSGSNAYAAGACAVYRGGGYDDWYLPSLDELGLIEAMRSVINTTSTNHGGSALQDDVYWSSFECGNGAAWCQGFSDGSQGYVIKTNTYFVRAVRAF